MPSLLFHFELTDKPKKTAEILQDSFDGDYLLGTLYVQKRIDILQISIYATTDS